MVKSEVQKFETEQLLKERNEDDYKQLRKNLNGSNSMSEKFNFEGAKRGSVPIIDQKKKLKKMKKKDTEPKFYPIK